MVWPNIVATFVGFQSSNFVDVGLQMNLTNKMLHSLYCNTTRLPLILWFFIIKTCFANLLISYYLFITMSNLNLLDPICFFRYVIVWEWNTRNSLTTLCTKKSQSLSDRWLEVWTTIGWKVNLRKSCNGIQ